MEIEIKKKERKKQDSNNTAYSTQRDLYLDSTDMVTG